MSKRKAEDVPTDEYALFIKYIYANRNDLFDKIDPEGDAQIYLTFREEIQGLYIVDPQYDEQIRQQVSESNPQLHDGIMTQEVLDAIVSIFSQDEDEDN